MRRVIIAPLFVASLLLLFSPGKVLAKHSRSKGAKLECENKRYGRDSGCTMSNSTHSTRRCKYLIYYTWKPGSRWKAGRKTGTVTLAKRQTIWVIRGHGWRYRWSTVSVSCK